MATAAAYDEWNDQGIALTNEEVDSFDPRAVGERAVARLLTGIVVCARIRELGPPKPSVWQKAQAKMTDCATWHCQVAELPGLDREHVADLPDASSREGKALTVTCHGWIKKGVGSFLDAWRITVEIDLRNLVTLGRRKVASGKMVKADRSKCNKIANALVRELMVIEKLKTIEESMTA